MSLALKQAFSTIFLAWICVSTGIRYARAEGDRRAECEALFDDHAKRVGENQKKIDEAIEAARPIAVKFYRQFSRVYNYWSSTLTPEKLARIKEFHSKDQDLAAQLDADELSDQSGVKAAEDAQKISDLQQQYSDVQLTALQEASPALPGDDIGANWDADSDELILQGTSDRIAVDDGAIYLGEYVDLFKDNPVFPPAENGLNDDQVKAILVSQQIGFFKDLIDAQSKASQEVLPEDCLLLLSDDHCKTLSVSASGVRSFSVLPDLSTCWIGHYDISENFVHPRVCFHGTCTLKSEIPCISTNPCAQNPGKHLERDFNVCHFEPRSGKPCGKGIEKFCHRFSCEDASEEDVVSFLKIMHQAVRAAGVPAGPACSVP